MFCDFVLMKKSDELVRFAKSLGYSKIYFVEDIQKLNIVNGGDLNVNRKAVESAKTDILLNPHLVKMKDNLHYRNSGLNQVLCKLAVENNVAIGVSFDSLKNAVSVGRVMQNIVLCRKYGVKIMFFSYAKSKNEMRTARDVFGLLEILGLRGSDAKKALEGL